MLENRKSKRYHSIARVGIPGVLEEDIMLRNISITGCCVQCLSVVDITANSEYEIKIEPESEAKIGNFTLPVECKWVRHSDDSSEIGFSIAGFPQGKTFQRYADYLAFRSQFESS